MSEPAHPAPIERPLVVAIAYDELCMFEFSIAVEIFGLPRPEMGDRWYDFKVAAVSAGPLRATGGVQVSADGDLDLVRAAHTVVIPGWTGVETTVPDELKQALLAAYANGARIMSICSGVFVLASTGLLDGRRATTHWRYMESLAAKYPNIIVQPDVLYVDEDQLLTSAGSAAGIDLSLHLVRRDFGVAAANSVARRLVVPAHRDGGQAQFTERPVAKYPNHSLGDLFDWMRQHLDQPLTIKTLAQRASTSPRSLLRRFVATTGLSPSAWLVRERVHYARDLLETSRDSVDRIAEQCGFRTSATLRHHFRLQFGVSPSRYRRQFGLADGPARPARERATGG